MTLAQVQGNGNPRGLKTILGYEYGTKTTNPNNVEGNMQGTGTFPSVTPVTPDTFETANGPFRVVMPQSNEGPGSTNDNYSPLGDGDTNSVAWNKKLRAVEILPLPAGMTEMTDRRTRGDTLRPGDLLREHLLLHHHGVGRDGRDHHSLGRRARARRG